MAVATTFTRLIVVGGALSGTDVEARLVESLPDVVPQAASRMTAAIPERIRRATGCEPTGGYPSVDDGRDRNSLVIPG